MGLRDQQVTGRAAGQNTAGPVPGTKGCPGRKVDEAKCLGGALCAKVRRLGFILRTV